MSRDDKSWIDRNLDLISKTWTPVETADEADLRITTQQIAIKMFECSPEVPQGTIEMLQEKLSETRIQKGLGNVANYSGRSLLQKSGQLLGHMLVPEAKEVKGD